MLKNNLYTIDKISKPQKFKSRSTAELKKIAHDIYIGRVFCNRQVEPSMFGTVFMVWALLDPMEKKEMIDNQCAGILAPSDWMVVKATETGGTMDSGWKTWRASVRTKCNSMQTQIDNASDVDALAALFTYTTTDGVTSRPLGEFPVKA